MSKSIQHFINSLISMGLTLLMLIGLLIVGPYVEGRFFPITKDINVTLQEVNKVKDSMYFRVEGYKIRNCTLLDVRILVDEGKGRAPIKGAIWVSDDGVGSKARALGFQDLGIWTIQPIGEHLAVDATYHCHPLWNTHVKLGEWSK